MNSVCEAILGVGYISTPSQNRVYFSEYCGYSIDLDSVYLLAKKITNTSLPTGPLKLVLWALSDAAAIREWRGTRMAEALLEGLNENACYEDIGVTATRISPPDGNYAMVMSLEEYQDGRVYTYGLRTIE